MAPRSKFTLIVLIVLIGIVGFLFLRNRETKFDFHSPKLIVSTLEKNIRHYKSFVDSLKRDSLRNYLVESYKQILNIPGKIDVIGERLKIKKDSLLIEMFILLEDRKNIFYLISSNGKVSVKEIKAKNRVPDFSIYCNSHYFFLPSRNKETMEQKSYSLLWINKQYLNIKIFYSDKFDDFINVECRCDSSLWEGIVDYIDTNLETF